MVIEMNKDINKNNNLRKVQGKDKISLEYSLKINDSDIEENLEYGYDFVPKDFHATNISEQKIKVKEIEDKTK